MLTAKHKSSAVIFSMYSLFFIFQNVVQWASDLTFISVRYMNVHFGCLYIIMS